MNDENQNDVQQQLSELRREVRRNRGWLIYIAVGVTILLFVPWLPQAVAFSVLSAGSAGKLGPSILLNILAILIVVFVGAVVVSRFSGPRRPSVDEKHDG